MKEENAVRDKSYAFARRCVKLYKYLCEEKKEIFFQNSCSVAEQASVQILRKVNMGRRKWISQVSCQSHKKKQEKPSFC